MYVSFNPVLGPGFPPTVRILLLGPGLSVVAAEAPVYSPRTLDLGSARSLPSWGQRAVTADVSSVGLPASLLRKAPEPRTVPLRLGFSPGPQETFLGQYLAPSFLLLCSTDPAIRAPLNSSL